MTEGKRYVVVGGKGRVRIGTLRPRMMSGYYGIEDRDTGQLVRSGLTSRAVVVEIADRMNAWAERLALEVRP